MIQPRVPGSRPRTTSSSRTQPPRSDVVPAFVELGQSLRLRVGDRERRPRLAIAPRERGGDPLGGERLLEPPARVTRPGSRSHGRSPRARARRARRSGPSRPARSRRRSAGGSHRPAGGRPRTACRSRGSPRRRRSPRPPDGRGFGLDDGRGGHRSSLSTARYWEPCVSRRAIGMVARGRPVSDLRPLLRRRERRRRRRPPRDHRASRSSGVARGRRCVAVADHALAEPGLGVRRLGLSGRPPRPRGPRDAGRAGRRGRIARHPHRARPRSEPHERPPSVVRRRSLLETGGPPRLVRLGGSTRRRIAAEQLAVGVRGQRVGARPLDRSVLPPQLPRRAAGSQLVERGGPSRVRGHPAVLARPRRGRLPDRRGERADPRSGPPRQSPGDGRRPRARSGGAVSGRSTT